LRELLRACWVEATLRDFARNSAIKYKSVQQYSFDFERIQIRSLKIRRLYIAYNNYLKKIRTILIINKSAEKADESADLWCILGLFKSWVISGVCGFSLFVWFRFS
jgi:hypothetical protein